jgi:hypothetical protein
MGWRVDSLKNRDAAAWVQAALDPADSVGANGAILGIPDHNDQPSVVIGWRQLEQLAPDAALALTATDTWDCDMLTFEGPYVLAAGQMRKSSDPTKYHNFWIVNRMFNFDAVPGVPGPGPTISTDVANNSSVNPGSTNWIQNVAAFRPVYSSLTAEFVGATLTDQGTLATAQLPNLWTRKVVTDTPLSIGTLTNFRLAGFETQVADCTFGTVFETGITGLTQSAGVPKIDNIMMVAPGSRTWKASKGAYIPLRYQQPVFSYTDAAAIGQTLSFVHPWDADMELPSGAYPTGPSLTGTPIVGAQSMLMRAGGLCLRGLYPTTTFSLCFRTGFEILPFPASPWSANLTPSCTPEDAAVEAYFKLRHSLPDAFESAWNIAGLVKKVVSGATSVASKLAKPLATASKAANAVSSYAQPESAPQAASTETTGQNTGRKAKIAKVVAAVKARRGK